ncbi:hypothetical protein GGF32_001197 [Allomyces javanicus]|nr:hypothetical protein GGF32_001197 [Allomyces javanicus]
MAMAGRVDATTRDSPLAQRIAAILTPKFTETRFYTRAHALAHALPRAHNVIVAEAKTMLGDQLSTMANLNAGASFLSVKHPAAINQELAAKIAAMTSELTDVIAKHEAELRPFFPNNVLSALLSEHDVRADDDVHCDKGVECDGDAVECVARDNRREVIDLLPSDDDDDDDDEAVFAEPVDHDRARAMRAGFNEPDRVEEPAGRSGMSDESRARATAVDNSNQLQAVMRISCLLERHENRDRGHDRQVVDETITSSEDEGEDEEEDGDVEMKDAADDPLIVVGRNNEDEPEAKKKRGDGPTAVRPESSSQAAALPPRRPATSFWDLDETIKDSKLSSTNDDDDEASGGRCSPLPPPPPPPPPREMTASDIRCCEVETRLCYAFVGLKRRTT